MKSGAMPAATATPSRGRVWGVFGGAAAITLAAVYGLVARWGVPRWTLGLTVSALEHAQALAPDAPETYLAVSAVAQYVRRDPAFARRSAERGLAAHPENVHLMRRVASLEATDEPERALGVLRRTVQLDPRSVVSWGSLATVLMNLHRPDEARDAVARGIEPVPRTSG
jgi:hypothetical protein